MNREPHASRSVVGLALPAALLLLAALPALAAEWRLDPERSRLAFVATWEGEPFEGVFHRFAGTFVFDPRYLASSRFDVSVDVATADTRNRDRDAAMLEPAWLAANRHPKARFVTTGFRALGDGRYAADGTLTLKGVTRPVTLPFAWHRHGQTATLRGAVTLDRGAFAVGQGELAGGEVIGLDVEVRVDLTLTRLPGG
jgi:polyisoprenoid-binding protein YceI